MSGSPVSAESVAWAAAVDGDCRDTELRLSRPSPPLKRDETPIPPLLAADPESALGGADGGGGQTGGSDGMGGAPGTHYLVEASFEEEIGGTVEFYGGSDAELSTERSRSGDKHGEMVAIKIIVESDETCADASFGMDLSDCVPSGDVHWVLCDSQGP